MRVKLFNVPVFEGEADEAELNRFLAAHRVSSMAAMVVGCFIYLPDDVIASHSAAG